MDTQLIDSTITQNSVKKLNVRCQSHKYKPVKEPPEKYIKSIQLDLFSQFITNDKSVVSNTVEIWENIPKYFLTERQVKKLRSADGLAEPYEWNYSEKDNNFTVRLQPALIKQTNGKYKAFFPGITEEIIEEALKKFLTIQNHGLHDPEKVETWVRFSLSMLHRELKEQGRERNRNEIRHAIDVMSLSIITLFKNSKEIWKGSILQDLLTVGREEYLADSSSLHICRLPLFISHAINQLEYRQFNYKRLMNCDEQLARWIYKRLINRYRQANLMNNYHFMYSSLKESALLLQNRETDNRKKVISALKELVNKNIIYKYEAQEVKKNRIISDVKYIIFPSNEFISEQKAANKRSNVIEGNSVNLFTGQSVNN
ncbi:MAG: hypothetical protein KIT59_00440 [Nitrosomonas sp.]|nr:hypothetical protein [Nitrosomonas sp.]